MVCIEHKDRPSQKAFMVNGRSVEPDRLGIYGGVSCAIEAVSDEEARTIFTGQFPGIKIETVTRSNTPIRKPSWQQFDKTGGIFGDFFGIVDTRDGYWSDSALAYDTAITFCAAEDGIELDTFDDALKYMEKGHWAIVPSRMLRLMYEAGLIK